MHHQVIRASLVVILTSSSSTLTAAPKPKKLALCWLAGAPWSPLVQCLFFCCFLLACNRLGAEGETEQDHHFTEFVIVRACVLVRRRRSHGHKTQGAKAVGLRLALALAKVGAPPLPMAALCKCCGKSVLPWAALHSVQFCVRRRRVCVCFGARVVGLLSWRTNVCACACVCVAPQPHICLRFVSGARLSVRASRARPATPVCVRVSVGQGMVVGSREERPRGSSRGGCGDDDGLLRLGRCRRRRIISQIVRSFRFFASSPWPPAV